MGNHSPAADIVPENKAIRRKYKDTRQVSTHIANYQKEWIEKKKEDDSFNLSKNIRKMLDHIILQSEIDLPDEVLVDEEELENDNRSGIEVFISKDD